MMRDVSEKVLTKIRAAKKSANLSLEFDPKNLEMSKVWLILKFDAAL